MNRFPSPLGVSYFQIKGNHKDATYLFGFRPLSGYLISKFLSLTSLVIAVCKVSVPSRGILFPNTFCIIMGNIKNSFRPLSGYLISK